MLQKGHYRNIRSSQFARGKAKEKEGTSEKLKHVCVLPIGKLFQQTQKHTMNNGTAANELLSLDIIDGTSIIVIFVALFSLSFVLLSIRFCKPQNNKEKATTQLVTKRQLYEKMTHFSIFFLLVSDLLFTICYLPTQVLRIVIRHVATGSLTWKICTFFMYVVGLLSDEFLLASSIWALLITISIMLAIQNMQVFVQQSRATPLSEEELAKIHAKTESIQYHKNIYHLRKIIFLFILF